MKKKVQDLQPGDEITGLYYGEDDFFNPAGYVSGGGWRTVKSVKKYPDETGAPFYIVSVHSGDGMYMVPENTEIEVKSGD